VSATQGISPWVDFGFTDVATMGQTPATPFVTRVGICYGNANGKPVADTCAEDPAICTPTFSSFLFN